jgi:hypothetical protein
VNRTTDTIGKISVPGVLGTLRVMTPEEEKERRELNIANTAPALIAKTRALSNGQTHQIRSNQDRT